MRSTEDRTRSTLWRIDSFQVSVYLIGILTFSMGMILSSCEPWIVDFLDVEASRETYPVANAGDAADDVCIWVHPSDTGQSLVIGTDKRGSLNVYDLQGNLLNSIGGIYSNNVDIRYGFVLDGDVVDLVCASEDQSDSILVFKVDPSSPDYLVDVSDGTLDAGMDAYGLCMYRGGSGEYYVFLVGRTGEIRQWRLVAKVGGKVGIELVRTMSLGSIGEGCVADDENSRLYVAEENVGIWKYGADPVSGDSRVSIDSIQGNPDLESDIEGLTIYRTEGGGGYLLASIQGRSGYAVYDRVDGSYFGMFRIIDGASIDGTSDSDGIDVVNLSLGAEFNQGLFIAQDGSNGSPTENQNFKLVPWERIAGAFTPSLTIDAAYGVRP